MYVDVGNESASSAISATVDMTSESGPPMRNSNPPSHKGVHITKGDQLEGKKTRSAIKRLAAVPWIFGGFGLFLTACVIIFILTYQYMSLSDNVEQMVVGKATTVLDGAVQSVRGYRTKVERVTGLIQQQLSKAGNTSQDPYYFLNSLNSTLHRTVGTRVRSRLVNIVTVHVLGDPVQLQSFPKQNLAEQSSCRTICARPGDPTFTQAMSYGLVRDFAPETRDEYRSVYANPNNTGSFYRMGTVNQTTMPSWARSSGDDLFNKKLVPLSPFRVQPFINGVSNGTAFDGSWFPVEVTSSASGVSYYFSGYNQQFVHPKGNLSIIVNVLSGIKAFQDVLTNSAKSQSIGLNAHLLLVDQLARVITYNHDIYGDRRLASCTVTVLPGTPSRPCGDLFGVEHPTPFIARLFQNHKAFIMSFTSSARQKWFDDEDSRYLLVAQDISSDAHSRIAAVFVLPEKDVVGNLKRNTLLLVLFSAFIVLVGCLIVVAAGFVSLRNAQRTVVLVAKLASSITRYDVDAADVTIAEEQSSRMCMTAATPMEKQFSEIIDNLRTYRPFLPPSLLLETRRRQSNTTNSDDTPHSTNSSSGDSIPAPLFIHRSERFVPFEGSLVLVDVGNLPIAAHIQHRSAEGSGQVIKAFLHRCLRIVERHGGVTESIQANQLLASFNCHTSTPLHQQVACRCALELQAALTGESAWCAHRINVAISVTSGAGLLGSGGTATVKGRLIAGEAVDLIRRLPALQRLLGVGVLATEGTAAALSGAVVAVPIDVISPTWGQEGRSSAIIVYEVVATKNAITPNVLAECKIRTVGFTYLHDSRDPKKAATTFLQLPSDVMGRYSVMRLIYLSELLAAQSYSNLHRNETPWEELEGRAFFELHRAEALSLRMASSRSLLNVTTTSTPGPSPVKGGQRRHTHYDVLDNSTSMTLEGGHSSAILPTSLIRLFTSIVDGIPDTMSGSSNKAAASEGGTTTISDSNIRASVGSSQPTIGGSSTTITNNGHHYDSISEAGRRPPVYVDAGGGVSAESLPAMAKSMSSSSRNLTPTNAPSVTAVGGDKYYATSKTFQTTGQCTSGNVILALHENGGLVAMRQIPFTSLRVGVEPLIQEMELLSSLSHPNISSYVTCAVNQDDSTFCIMSEYLPAGSLSDLLRVSAVPSGQGSTCILSAATVLKLATDIASGLHYLHTRNPPILHLDVRPQNILMTTEGSCKLVEFGTSHFFSETAKVTLACGTPMYMAPEAAAGKFSAASDIYSLGITVLHMVLGKPPWDHVHGDDSSFLTRLTQDATLRPNIPDWIDPKLGALLERCTSRDPTHRPTTTEVLHDLTSA